MDKLPTVPQDVSQERKKWELSGLSQRMLRSHWIGGENLPDNQEENIMIEVYYAEDDETIGKSVKNIWNSRIAK